ncbi:bem46 protein [Paramecium bursaria]
MFEQALQLGLNIAIVLGLVLIGLLVLLYISQNSLLFMPAPPGTPKSPSGNPYGFKDPSEQGLKYEDVTINTLDHQVLRGWLIFWNDPKNNPTIIFFHENAGNIGTRLQYLALYQKMVHVNLLIVAYRGYSDSTGQPSEQGLQFDSEAIVKYALNHQQLDTSRIFIHGRSLGGGVATYVSTQNIAAKIRGIILENTFTSIDAMAERLFPKLKIFKSLILKNHFPSINYVRTITKPILFIMSGRDEIVPMEMMAELFSAAKASIYIKKFLIEQGDHNSNWTLDQEGYFKEIKEFLNR